MFPLADITGDGFIGWTAERLRRLTKNQDEEFPRRRASRLTWRPLASARSW